MGTIGNKEVKVIHELDLSKNKSILEELYHRQKDYDDDELMLALVLGKNWRDER